MRRVALVATLVAVAVTSMGASVAWGDTITPHMHRAAKKRGHLRRRLVHNAGVPEWDLDKAADAARKLPTRTVTYRRTSTVERSPAR